VNAATMTESGETRAHLASDDETPSAAAAPIVLVAEDHAQMRRYLCTTLLSAGFRVVEAQSGAQVIAQATSHSPDLILLGLRDLDFARVMPQLREWTAAPVLILSTRDREGDKIVALDAGANDYLTKPFGTGELLARMRVWLRQTQRANGEPMGAVLEVGDLRIDFANRLCFVEGREVRLTPTEYKLFGMLMRNPGKVLTHEHILLKVWGPRYTRERQYLRVYMGHLRQKLERDPARPRYILTEAGVGYRLRTEQ
jgi:two-component system KDP operon response regulator KdpE